MSSDFYPACVSRNLVRAGTFGYHENAKFLSRPDDAIQLDAGMTRLRRISWLSPISRGRGRRAFGWLRGVDLTRCPRNVPLLSVGIHFHSHNP
ncbi:hypothetical protein GGE67_001987 [Rhizobium leucaenae]|jgi:hypothetical protein|uniref:Uncharacterized protein n=1 Tax=Rhizobium leucaenae TaxID=29450 RepID=A0A7W6ZQ88_9HYPH|nr:hypothetical protein [Rhizobium leucaenae]MBB6301378.1 hypothetical protein [Rhizobium leucaenae]